MNPPVCIGIGCRRGIAAAPIVALVRAALAEGGLSAEGATLFTIADKRDERGLTEAAAALETTVSYFPRDVLAAIATPTRSERTVEIFGVSSVAESAALAGAGAGASLVVPRIARDGVTCAIARGGA